MAIRREHPYIWATWLPRLLTGENSCEWAAWFKANHQGWNRVPSDFNQTEWLLNHTALLNKRRTDWEIGGFDVDVETQNRFELRGKTATLAGRPDIIAHRDDEAVIVDAKTGQEGPSHVVQVMIYLYAVPMALERYRKAKLRGQVTYQGRTVRIPGGSRRRPVRPEPRRADPTDLGRRTRKADAVTVGVPVLRHQCRRLPSAHGRSLRARSGRNHRLLKLGRRMAGTQVSESTIMTTRPWQPITPLETPSDYELAPRRRPAPAVAQPTVKRRERRPDGAAPAAGPSRPASSRDSTGWTKPRRKLSSNEASSLPRFHQAAPAKTLTTCWPSCRTT